MASNLTAQVRHCCRYDRSRDGRSFEKITVDVKGEILELKNTVNTMVDQLNSFASEVTRCGRARSARKESLWTSSPCAELAGTWKDLTDSVNFMATNLTNQVRGIAKVVAGVANGDLNKSCYSQPKAKSQRWLTRSIA